MEWAGLPSLRVWRQDRDTRYYGNCHLRTGGGFPWVVCKPEERVIWHISAVSLDTGFDLPAAQIPIYLLNATVIGLIWGLLRHLSGSVLVCSVSHALWNGLDYPLFGFGDKIGTLGITETAIYGPEVGFLGLSVNLVFAAALWRWVNQRRIEL